MEIPVHTPSAFPVDRICCVTPCFKLPTPLCGVHSAVELTGRGLVLGHFAHLSLPAMLVI